MDRGGSLVTGAIIGGYIVEVLLLLLLDIFGMWGVGYDSWSMKEVGMRGQVLLIEGAGQGAYDADQQLASSLRQALGPAYDVRYPAMPDEANAPYAQWQHQIDAALASMQGPAILVGHSVGGSVIAKWMSERGIEKPIAGVFLIATPFWGGDGWRYEGYQELELANAFALRSPLARASFCTTAATMRPCPFPTLPSRSHPAAGGRTRTGRGWASARRRSLVGRRGRQRPAFRSGAILTVNHDARPRTGLHEQI